MCACLLMSRASVILAQICHSTILCDTHAAGHGGDALPADDLDRRPECRQARRLDASQLDASALEADPESAAVAADWLEVHREDLFALAKACARNDRRFGQVPPLDGPILGARQDVLASTDDSAAGRRPGVRCERPNRYGRRRAQRRVDVEDAAERSREDDLQSKKSTRISPAEFRRPLAAMY